MQALERSVNLVRMAVVVAMLGSAGAWAVPAKSTAVKSTKKAAKVSKVEDPAAANAHEMLKTCEQRPVSDGYLFQCDRMVAMVVEKTATTAELLDSDFEMIHSLGGSLSLSDVKVDVGDKKLPAVAFDLSSEEKSREHILGQALAIDLAKGRARTALCFSSKPTETSAYQCGKILNALVTVGTAPFDVSHKGPLEPMFLGRKIGVPDGCTTISADATSFRVECPDGASIFYSKARTIRAAEMIAGEFHENFLRSGTAAPDRPCLLGGVPVTCQVVDSEKVTFYLATTTVGSDPIIAVCYQEPQLIVVHPVCAEVFSF